MELVPDPAPPDPRATRARLMIQRSKSAVRVAIGLVAAVVVAVPYAIGERAIAAAGVGLLAVLLVAFRAADDRPGHFRVASHLLYGGALSAVAYAVFGAGLPSAITVYFPALVLLGAAHILGARAALLWSVPSLLLVGAGVFAAPDVAREVSPVATFAVRAATLLTILAFAMSFRRAHDLQAAELLRGATTDALTGLANRRELDRALEEARLRAQRFERHGAVLFVDLDGVKVVNDTFGHAAGDDLIRTTADRIAAATRKVDTPARLGGDEFVILLSEFEDPKAAEVVARKLLAALAEPLRVGQEWIEPSASIGLASFPDAARDAHDLLRLADDTMYQAKRAGGNRIFLRDGRGLREVV